MLRIRSILGNAFLLSRERLSQVQEVFAQAFPGLVGYADKLPSLLRDPVSHGYRSVLLVAEGAVGRVDGFALLLHFAKVDCCFLDFIAVRPGIRGSGLGAALYEAAREYAANSGARGLYLEIEPDNPGAASGDTVARDDRARLRFYEQHGVRVIDGTDYSVPVGDPPTSALLLYDSLGHDAPLSRATASEAVEMILTRRFGHIADPEYVRRVVESFRDDPVCFRSIRTAPAAEPPSKAVTSQRLGGTFAIVMTPKHEIHHVRERGYFERPIRAEAIRETLGPTGLFTTLATRAHGEAPIRAVHDADLVQYLQTVCSKLNEGRPVYPDTFPIRRPDRRPKQLAVQAGYYCLDTGTPLYKGAYVAARASVDTALTAADEILAGRALAYAVCRPPGHHAGRRFFGGFCYFNNAAIAAQRLSASAKVAVLDLDFHHGNGTQDIFYEREDVLTVSVHGHPDHSYPYFSGFESETGEGRGLGSNRNFPLPPGTEGDRYLRVLNSALEHVGRAGSEVIVLSLGFDVMRGDPTGSFMLSADIMRRIGKRLVATGLPLLVIQEGGYNVRNIRSGSAAFFRGCAEEHTRLLAL
jgi:acetoin utilization deacetylase AcuC-like enzyme/GNAT superfamily N-acetyltransferase